MVILCSGSTHPNQTVEVELDDTAGRQVLRKMLKLGAGKEVRS